MRWPHRHRWAYWYGTTGDLRVCTRCGRADVRRHDGNRWVWFDQATIMQLGEPRE